MAREVEDGGRAGRPRAQRVPDVALHPRGHRRAAAVGIEALDLEPELAGALPEVRVLEPALVGERGIGERPEPALGGGGLGGMGERQRPRVASLQREVAEDHAWAGGILSQALVFDGAARARQVRVEDDDGTIAAHVVVVAERGHLGTAQVLHTGSLAAMVDLHGDDIVIRRFRDGDAEPFATATADPEIVAHSGLPGVYSVAKARDLFELYNASEDFVQVAIADAQTDAFLGTVILFSVARHERRCEVGFWLHPDGRGRGAAKQAVSLICDWAVRTWGIERFDAHSDSDNPGAHAVLERNGFSREGILRGWGARGAERVDAVMFGRLVGPVAESADLTPPE
jgi:RimJ/RimL family protein N-acetyltransferase